MAVLVLSGSVAVAGAVAVLISAVTGLLGWQLSKRAQVAAERRQEAIDKAPYIEQLQAWSWRTIKEAEAKAREVEDHCRQRLAEERADCTERLQRVREDFERRLRDQEVQAGARVLAAERREQYWRRIARGEANGDPPPTRRD